MDSAKRIDPRSMQREYNSMSNMRKQAYILYVSAKKMDIFAAAAFSSPIMEAAAGCIHNSGPAAFNHGPTVVESVLGMKRCQMC